MTTHARPVALKRPIAALICGKCVKHAGGKGGKAARHLGRALSDLLGRPVRAVDTGCLKLCPKRHVLIGDATGRMMLVPGDDWLQQAVQALKPLASEDDLETGVEQVA